MTTENKSAGKGCVTAVVLLAVGFGVFGFFGILAAISVPAFIRYTKSTKVAEAESNVYKIKNLVQSFYRKECRFPANAVSSTLRSDGAKIVPDFSKDGWKEIKMTGSESVIFRYRMVNEENSLKIIADTNFSPNPKAHTVTVIMTSGPDCSVSAELPFTTNEFD